MVIDPVEARPFAAIANACWLLNINRLHALTRCGAVESAYDAKTP